MRYPLEIQPLVEDINRLLHHYGELLQRARSHTGNLAHALKTPLSIMRNQVAQLPPEDQAASASSLDQIQRHIDYHLGKARVTGAAKILGVSTPVRARVEYICRASRLYPGKTVDLQVPANLAVGVEEQDFDEMVGNPGERLQVVRQRAAHLQRRAGGWITLRIGDDGPGMSEDQIAKAVLRGCASTRRCRVPGLGLNIVSIWRKPIVAVSSWGGPRLGGLALPLPAQGGQGLGRGVRGPVGPCARRARGGARHKRSFVFKVRKVAMTDDPWALCHLDDSFRCLGAGPKGAQIQWFEDRDALIQFLLEDFVDLLADVGELDEDQTERPRGASPCWWSRAPG